MISLLPYFGWSTEMPANPLSYDVSGSDAWAPYFMITEEGNEYGIMPELVEAIFIQARIPAIPKNYPPKRTANYIIDGTLDVDVINPDWLPSESLKQQFVFSDNLIEVKEYYISRAGENTDTFFSDYKQSKSRVGMVRGYYYHNQADYIRVNFPSEKSLIEALDKKRVNMIICGDLPAQFWAESLGIKLNLAKVHSTGFLKLRMRKELAPLMPKLNEAIRQLHENGRIAAIVAKYM